MGYQSFMNLIFRVKRFFKMENEKLIEQKIRRRQFLSFAAFAGLGVTALGAWTIFRKLPSTDNGLPSLTRRIFSFNESINNSIFSHGHLASTYPVAMASPTPRLNGDVGLTDDNFNVNDWRLKIKQYNSTQTILEVTIEEIKKLPKTDICFDFKCIEGWDEIVHYGGVRLSDFLQHYNLGIRQGKTKDSLNPNDWYKYISLTTPDGNYYVGLDMKSALHPQTLLCYELNGKELPDAHGAPLRLIIPVKYGVKNLKRIGNMEFSDTAPNDYWHERGYIYDAAL
jgi:Oxidoreductase molybdopterin binding domain